MTCSVLKLAFPLLISCSCIAGSARQQPPPGHEPFTTAEGLVAELYASVTFEAGGAPDWNHVRSLFIDEAVIVLRTSREDTTIFSVGGFVDDFVKFIERADAGRTGFVERVTRMKSTVFGDMAHVLVLYEAAIPGSPRPPWWHAQRGRPSDADGRVLAADGRPSRAWKPHARLAALAVHGTRRWWIAAVTNELPGPDR